MFRFVVLVAIVAVSNAAYLPIRPLHKTQEVSPIVPRISGGEVTTILEVPYQAALIFEGKFFCGGSIVKSNIILTTAHCTTNMPTSYLNIRVGSNFHSSGGQLIPSERIILHEDFDVDAFDNDVSIVVLSYYIKFTVSTIPINLASQDFIVSDGALAQTSGWGMTEEGTYSNTIRRLVLRIVGEDVCKEAYSRFGTPITSRMICAGLIREGGKGPCRSDFGGPLVVDNTLVGITSWSYGCATPGYPAVWARISSFRNWIDIKLSQI